jgi:type IV secretion system protein VirB5
VVKNVIAGIVAIVAISVGSPVQAGGMPVFDAANLAQAVSQIQQMTMQLEQLKQQYNSMNGGRNMGSLINNPQLRRYLPDDYQTILNSGYGNSQVIRNNSRVYGINQTTLGAGTDTAKAFEASAMQASLNRATSEEAYSQASVRFNDLQVLLNEINSASDAKSIADLQARIQVEEVMLKNESIKLQMLGQLQQAQRDLAVQRAVEIRMKSSRGGVPRF